MNTNLKYDVIIPIKYDDLGNIRTLIENVRRNINEVRDIVILTKVSKVQKDVVSELREKKVHLIEEDTLLPGITFDRVRSILEKNKGDVSSAGWFLQQFIKLGYSRVCHDAYYLVWDADTIPVRKISFFTEKGSPVLDVKREYHWQYFETISLLFQDLKKQTIFSYISEHMLFNTSVTKEMLNDIENNKGLLGYDFCEKILNLARNVAHPRFFSEFELYGTYCEARYPNLYSIRQLSSLRPAAMFFKAFSEKQLRWLGKDFDVVTLERCDFGGSCRIPAVCKVLSYFYSPLRAVIKTKDFFSHLSRLPIGILKRDYRRMEERSEFDFCFSEKPFYSCIRKEGNKKKTIYLDLTGNICFAKYRSNVSGVERVVANLAKSLIETYGDVQFVFYNYDDSNWYSVRGLNAEDFSSLILFSKISKSRHIFQRCSSDLHDAYACKPRYKKLTIFLKYHLDKARYKHRPHRASFENGRVVVEPFGPAQINSGDIFLNCHWINDATRYTPFLDQWKQYGGKIAFFYHDIIPIADPQFVTREAEEVFRTYFNLFSRFADTLITSAAYNKKVFLNYYHNVHNYAYTKPIYPIGLPVAFCENRKMEGSNVSNYLRWIKAYPFCLTVGSVGERKNHFELLQAWRKFINSKNYNNELLVIAGNFSDFAGRIVEIANSLNGTVICSRDPSDADLQYLYENCAFTLNLSLMEGWGLPVTESLYHEKPTIVLNESSLPEAANGVGVLVDRNTEEVADNIARLFNDKRFYAEVVETIQANRNGFTTQAEFTKKLIAITEVMK